MSNEELYARCNVTPASLQVVYARWRLFGHTLRMEEDTPARLAMQYYFVKDLPGRKGNRITIASVLSDEYEAATGVSIRNAVEYSEIVKQAQDRNVWHELVSDVYSAQFHAREIREQRRSEQRQTAKRKREEQLPVKVAATHVRNAVKRVRVKC